MKKTLFFDYYIDYKKILKNNIVIYRFNTEEEFIFENDGKNIKIKIDKKYIYADENDKKIKFNTLNGMVNILKENILLNLGVINLKNENGNYYNFYIVIEYNKIQEFIEKFNNFLQKNTLSPF